MGILQRPYLMAGRAGAPPSFKLTLLGESAVGKSSLILRAVRNEFDDYRESTIGAAFLTLTIPLEQEGQSIKFECWDTAGQERYKSLAPMYYRNARVAIVVFDVTSEASLEKARSWIRELQRQADPNILLVLAGNKADLEAQCQVTKQAAEALANEESALYFETSAKSGMGITEMFQVVAEKMSKQVPAQPKQNNSVQLESKSSNPLEGCAC